VSRGRRTSLFQRDSVKGHDLFQGVEVRTEGAPRGQGRVPGPRRVLVPLSVIGTGPIDEERDSIE